MLSHLPRQHDARLLVGPDTADDAGVYQITDDLALVQTVDLFPPVVDDAYTFGAIGAANALSDVYAMGGRPLTALNLIGWPRELDLALLGEVLRGGAEKLAEADAIVVGGHSWEDAEPKFGLSVTGLVDPKRLVTNAGAQVGDTLVLTKPLGLGIITTGLKNGVASASAIAEAVSVMSELNRSAGEAMLEVGVHAATDVTGFGLLGHLREIAAASHVGAELQLGQIPVIDEAWSLVRREVVPAGTRRNLDSLKEHVDFGNLSVEEQLVLADAQTSGGLLICIAADKTDELLKELVRRKTLAAAIIGHMTDDRSGRIVVRR